VTNRRACERSRRTRRTMRLRPYRAIRTMGCAKGTVPEWIGAQRCLGRKICAPLLPSAGRGRLVTLGFGWATACSSKQQRTGDPRASARRLLPLAGRHTGGPSNLPGLIGNTGITCLRHGAGHGSRWVENSRLGDSGCRFRRTHRKVHRRRTRPAVAKPCWTRWIRATGSI
jgi:hypothetical protein